ncbi:type VI secretion system-associated FHA domain protein TagH [Henriciella aquimarina]|uniref:type VI secretion system-associated FHA domain protein TagH n=1 Tax=Henriciella aquimarina TaxID=545261 RepID=UPI000A066223|nr:type VI secretion system-associated FHA domain protein TagH [Henriciella aquimarina]
MITLRLYREDEPGRQVDSYIMGDGDVTVGRDSGAVWVIDDPDRRLSRFHCTISARDGRVFVYDTSANGVYLGVDRDRIEPGVEVDVPAGETLQIGRFLIVVDADAFPDDALLDPAGSRTNSAPLGHSPDEPVSSAIPDQWTEPDLPAQPRPDRGDAAGEVVMLEAFCEGAKIDPSYLASEDPSEIMRRVGEIYQQLVLGLGDLMSERASVKSEYSLERTTIGATANNPLKWAPTHRLAVDLVSERTGGFLNGAEAVKECFEDLKGHSLCLVAGSRAAVSAVLDEFDPKAIEAGAKAKTSLFMERSEASWRRMKSLHEAVSSDPFNDGQSLVNLAFKRGYEDRLGELKTQGEDE